MRGLNGVSVQGDAATLMHWWNFISETNQQQSTDCILCYDQVKANKARRPRTNLHEELLEGLPKLAAHPAVDAEVEGVGEADEEVDDQRDDADQLVVEELVDAGRHLVQDDEDAEGQLDGQKYLESETLFNHGA